MKKDVLIIFKTHLDIGFTDYSQGVINRYVNEYIPNAIRVGYKLLNTETPFRWTMGSWMIWEALKRDTDGSVDRAIRDGILNWHALPFTTHTELMNSALLEYGLNISQRLDERFNKKTIAAKMTDVPGHTIGMVPFMQERGIEFLHIGVNPATPLPPVPELFVWKNGQSKVTVMYQGAYGEAVELDDFVIYFAHTNDNCGPQSEREILEIYRQIQQKYPEYNLRAATLNDVAARIRNVKDVPVVEKEIGDTWIHGAATDPEKVSRYRKILRYIESNKSDADLSEHLLLVPEHTWGMDFKTFFQDKTHFYHTELEEIREERKIIEASWKEQRSYVSEAEKCLNIVSDYPIVKPDLSKYERLNCTDFPNIELSWQLFDNSDYERYTADYLRLTEENRGWALQDFTKMGLPSYKGGIFVAKPNSAYINGNEKLYLYKFEDALSAKYGLPYFIVRYDEGVLEIKWFEKKASRLPQAFWLKINGFNEDWELHRLGTWMKPQDIIGSPLIAAVDRGVRNDTFTIEPLDSPLVAPYGRRLLQYNCKVEKQDLYFNLYNNIWNTNFPMWYEDDAMFRFVVSKR